MVIETARLLFRQPVEGDLQAIFDGYASDPDVTRYLGWPRHQSLDDTRLFLAFSDAHWATWGTGPLVACARAGGELLGSTGLIFESAADVITGYVLARRAWGHGYATESLQAMVDLARALRIPQLSAGCHPDHRASQRVLEKCGFVREAIVQRSVFPNLGPEPTALLTYRRVLAPTPYA